MVDTLIYWFKRILFIGFAVVITWWLITHPQFVVQVFTAVITFAKTVGQGGANALSTIFG